MMHGPTAGHTAYHPRWLRRRVSTYWWLDRRSYFLFILRELTSVFVAWAVVYLLMVVVAVSRGPAAFDALMTWSARPHVLAWNVLTLSLLIYHAVTWFNLAPQAMVVHVGKTKVPGALIALSNYAAWAVVSAGVIWIVMGS